jgi:hypothetical protein
MERLPEGQVTAAISFFNNPTAQRKLTPCVFITQSITEPPAAHEK